MSYVVLARKYRPEDIEDMVGQETVASTIEGALSSGRLAHAYLFAGPRGVGKTSMARIVAKTHGTTDGQITPRVSDVRKPLSPRTR